MIKKGKKQNFFDSKIGFIISILVIGLAIASVRILLSLPTNKLEGIDLFLFIIRHFIIGSLIGAVFMFILDKLLKKA